MGEFTCALDLGQVSDPSAMVILETIPRPTHNPAMVRTITETVLQHPNWDGRTQSIFGNPSAQVHRRVLLQPDGSYGEIPPDDEPSYDVRHVQRWKLGTPYPKIVDDVVNMMMGAPLSGECPLVVDATGVGRPVVDMFYEHKRWDFPLTPVVITGGNSVTHDKGYMHVPKVDLVSTVQVLLQSRRLRFPLASKLPEVATLVTELSTFHTKINIATGHESFAAWRDHEHDDLVLALALALWHAERSTFRLL